MVVPERLAKAFAGDRFNLLRITDLELFDAIGRAHLYRRSSQVTFVVHQRVHQEKARRHECVGGGNVLDRAADDRQLHMIRVAEIEDVRKSSGGHATEQ